MHNLVEVRRSALAVTTLALAGLLAALLPAHLVAADGAHRVRVIVVHLVLISCLLPLWWRVRRGPLTFRAASVICCTLGLIAIGDAVFLALIGDDLAFVGPQLLILMVTALLTSHAWVRWGLLAAAVAGFGLLLALGPRTAAAPHLVLLITAIGVVVGAHLLQGSTVAALAADRRRAQARLEELVAAERTRSESDRRLRQLFEVSPVGAALLDESGAVIELNNAWRSVVGEDSTDLLDRAEVTGGQRRFGTAETRDPVASVRSEVRFRNADGDWRWGWLIAIPILRPEGRIWTLAQLQDITETKDAEAALRRSEALQAARAALARSVQSGQDPRPAALESLMNLTGSLFARLVEETSGILDTTHAVDLRGADLALPPPEAPVAAVWERAEPVLLIGADVERGLRPGGPAATTVLWQPVSHQGRVTAVLCVGWSRLLGGRDDPAVEAVAVLAEDCGPAFSAFHTRTELEALVDTDPLTGVANRRGWQRRVREAAVLSGPRPLTLAVLDLDNFKLFNDTHGHQRGDFLLREFAQRAQTALRAGDVVARWGGEEFVLALPGCTSAAAGRLLNRIRQLVPGGQTCSAGHATLRPGENISDCLARADQALYEAKRAGRNRVVAAADIPVTNGSEAG